MLETYIHKSSGLVIVIRQVFQPARIRPGQPSRARGRADRRRALARRDPDTLVVFDARYHLTRAFSEFVDDPCSKNSR